MCDEGLAGHPELWRKGATLPSDRGPMGNLETWEQAEEYLGALAQMAQHTSAPGGEGALVALVDAHNRCIEERRRAGDLLKLHERWSARPVGGVGEPESLIAPKERAGGYPPAGNGSWFTAGRGTRSPAPARNGKEERMATTEDAKIPEVLFVREVAEVMRMSPTTVYKAIHAGELRAEQYGTGKNSMRVDRKAFEEWRERHRIGPRDAGHGGGGQ